MSGKWHDINSPGFGPFAENRESAAKPAAQEPAPEAAEKKTAPAEVRLSNPEFVMPADGYQQNKSCEIRVKAELLAETIRKTVTFDVFSRYADNNEIPEHSGLKGDIRNGVATATIPHLYYNEDFLRDRTRDGDATFDLWFVASHSRAEKKVVSSVLQLPAKETLAYDLVEMPDVLFNHNSAVPCLDEKGEFVGSLAAALIFAAQNATKEAIVFGHTDTSGEIDYNFELSDLRAKATLALLENDTEAFVAIAAEKSIVEDRQRILKSLTAHHGWECDPGPVDNIDGPRTQAGVKKFQAEYNSRKSESIAVDGVIGPQTWGAVFGVMRGLADQACKQAGIDANAAKLTYKSGMATFACGESFPIDQVGADRYRSSKNRRVDITFFNAGETPEITGPADKNTALGPADCPVYDKTKIEPRPINPGAGVQGSALRLRITADPANAEIQKDSYRLVCVSGGYDVVRTVAEHAIAGSGFFDLVFDNVTSDTKYRLEVTLGNDNATYAVAENLSVA